MEIFKACLSGAWLLLAIVAYSTDKDSPWAMAALICSSVWAAA